MKNITQEEWNSLISKDNNYTILDTRTAGECNTGIVENAIIIDFLQPDLFLSEINKLDKNKTYYIYCRSGNRSGQACHIMESLGFVKTYNLIGGMLTWKGNLVSM